MLALQDLSSWLLEKVGVKVRAIRSQALVLVPISVAIYLLLWPQVKRIMTGGPFAGFRVMGSTESWGSFMAHNFWRNLPGMGIASATFLVCGFLIVALLGSRAFCRYGCPYGVLFSIASKLAPGTIKLTADCNQCGLCTANCGSDIRVHEEVKKFGRVVNSRCLKDLDCVAICPQDAIHFGFARPSLFKSLSSKPRLHDPQGFTIAEEGILLVAAVFLFLVYRGLYDAVPILLTTGIAVIGSYSGVVFYRMLTLENVGINRFVLKKSRITNQSGKAFMTFVALLFLFTSESAFVHYNTWMGDARYADGNLYEAAQYLERASSLGLFKTARVEGELASIYLQKNLHGKAELHLRKLIEIKPDDLGARMKLARLVKRYGESAR